jgi:hypothetical protein
MMGWLESEWLAKVRMRDRMREAERKRLKRRLRVEDARLPSLLRLAAAWLSGRVLSPVRRHREPDCTNAGLGQSSEPPIGLIL